MKYKYNTLERSGDAYPNDDINKLTKDGSEYWNEKAETAEGGAVVITYFFSAEDVEEADGEAEHYPWADRVVSIEKDEKLNMLRTVQLGKTGDHNVYKNDEGAVIHLAQIPYVSEDGLKYKALAKSDNGDSYMVSWKCLQDPSVFDADGECKVCGDQYCVHDTGEDSCDWDDYTVRSL